MNPNLKIEEIFKFLNNISKDKIIETKHFIEQNTDRNINMFYNDKKLHYHYLLKHEQPVEISIQRKNKFRIKYIHKYCKYYDYSLVCSIKNDNLILITTINIPIHKRVGRN